MPVIVIQDGPPGDISSFDMILQSTPNVVAYANVTVTEASNNPGYYTSASISAVGFVSGDYYLNPKDSSGTIIGKLTVTAAADSGTYIARQSVRVGDMRDGVITAASIASNAITAAKIAGGALTISKFAEEVPANVLMWNGELATGVTGFDADALQANAQFSRDILEADMYVDTTATPWDMVAIKKGSGTLTTGTVLLRQKLRTTAAGNVTSTETIVGRRTES